MLKTENKLNSLALVGRDFSCDEIVRIQEYLENLNPNSRLICIESGFARQEFLETLKNLMKSPKPITEQDITNIELPYTRNINFGAIKKIRVNFWGGTGLAI
jgi:hypothetical protein